MRLRNPLLDYVILADPRPASIGSGCVWLA
jgi:hypothetical protein